MSITLSYICDMSKCFYYLRKLEIDDSYLLVRNVAVILVKKGIKENGKNDCFCFSSHYLLFAGSNTPSGARRDGPCPHSAVSRLLRKHRLWRTMPGTRKKPKFSPTVHPHFWLASTLLNLHPYIHDSLDLISNSLTRITYLPFWSNHTPLTVPLTPF